MLKNERVLTQNNSRKKIMKLGKGHIHKVVVERKNEF